MKIEEVEKLRALGKSYSEIGKIYNVSRQRVHRFVNKIISGSGREIVREKIRKRDNYTCQMCGKKWMTGKRKFDVHHKDFDSSKTRQVDTNEPIDNLITLCHKCHSIEHKRHRSTSC